MGFLRHGLAELHERKAHFVLTENPESKKPLWAGWNRRRPSADEVYAHFAFYRGRIGLIPGSLGCTVLDIDEGSPDALHEFPYSHELTSLSGKAHLWYRTKPLPSRKYNGLRLPDYQIRKADLITDSGFVVLANPIEAVEMLLDLPEIDELPPPLAEVVKLERPLRGLNLSGEGVERQREKLEHCPDTDFSRVYPGQRNDTMFRYLQRCPLSLVADYQTCLQLASQANAQMPIPMDESEVRGIAFSVFRNKAAYLQKAKSQGRQGGISSGESRRAETAERDAEIVRLVEEGMKKRAVAKHFGITPKAIRRILSR